MYSFQTTKTIDSKTCEPVKFTIRTFTDGLRTEVYDAVSAAEGELYLLEAEIEKAREDLGFLDQMSQQERTEHYNKLPKSDRDTLSRLYVSITAKRSKEVDPAKFRVGFVSIDNLEIDKKSVGLTADEVRVSGPPKLYAEILGAIEHEIRLNGEEKENLGLPSTSGAETDGEIQVITASNA